MSDFVSKRPFERYNLTLCSVTYPVTKHTARQRGQMRLEKRGWIEQWPAPSTRSSLPRWIGFAATDYFRIQHKNMQSWNQPGRFMWADRIQIFTATVNLNIIGRASEVCYWILQIFRLCVTLTAAKPVNQILNAVFFERFATRFDIEKIIMEIKQ